MGHNRGWEETASMFSGTSEELKTCNAALLGAPGRSWEEDSVGGSSMALLNRHISIPETITRRSWTSLCDWMSWEKQAAVADEPISGDVRSCSLA
ncbi:hypothetical protein AKJ16_DCAP13300 [Drosera capensis]